MSLIEATILMKKFIQKSYVGIFFTTGLQVKDFFKCSNSLKNKLITILYETLPAFIRSEVLR
jgi:hypothetical protein